MRLHLARKGFKGAVRRPAAAKAVNRGISQRAIEPWHHPFVGWRLLRPLEELGECILQDVFGKRPIADAPLEVAQKDTVVFQERLDRC